jgi:hypothetical protein
MTDQDNAPQDEEEEAAVEAAFIAGFREAPDKRAFLTLAGIPLTLPGRSDYKLVEVRLDDRYQVGSVSPGFGTSELSYQPLPGALVGHRTSLRFVYVSAKRTKEKRLSELRARTAITADQSFHY